MIDRRVTTVLLLLVAGCASTPRRLGEGTLVPVTPPTQPVEQLLANLRSSVALTRAGAAW